MTLSVTRRLDKAAEEYDGPTGPDPVLLVDGTDLPNYSYRLPEDSDNAVQELENGVMAYSPRYFEVEESDGEQVLRLLVHNWDSDEEFKVEIPESNITGVRFINRGGYTGSQLPEA